MTFFPRKTWGIKGKPNQTKTKNHLVQKKFCHIRRNRRTLEPNKKEAKTGNIWFIKTLSAWTVVTTASYMCPRLQQTALLKDNPLFKFRNTAVQRSFLRVSNHIKTELGLKMSATYFSVWVFINSKWKSTSVTFYEHEVSLHMKK